MSLPFTLPPLTANGISPEWLGNAFKINEEITQVLQYSANNKGWNDDLTFFHEESAGEQHFIDRASRDHAIYQLQKHVIQSKPTILEIGCSSGYMLERIKNKFANATIIGADIVLEPLINLANKLPDIPLLRFDLMHCPLPDNSFDAVVILNILEHIENDKLALQQIFRILKPGGVVIIEVPAGPHLYDIYDKMLMHYRRYILKDLVNLAKNIGFKIKNKSHLGFFLYPGFYLTKIRNKRFLNASLEKQKQIVTNNISSTGENKFFHAIMQSEIFLNRWIFYPTGIRCLLTCSKS